MQISSPFFAGSIQHQKQIPSKPLNPFDSSSIATPLNSDVAVFSRQQPVTSSPARPVKPLRFGVNHKKKVSDEEILAYFSKSKPENQGKIIKTAASELGLSRSGLSLRIKQLSEWGFIISERSLVGKTDKVTKTTEKGEQHLSQIGQDHSSNAEASSSNQADQPQQSHSSVNQASQPNPNAGSIFNQPYEPHPIYKNHSAYNSSTQLWVYKHDGTHWWQKVLPGNWETRHLSGSYQPL